ncbi:MAG: ABC transporter permease subunit [Acidimicrobiia bacterium]|nr:ABC transporter permease subunit [Acidimicrobiia bacterium]
MTTTSTDVLEVRAAARRNRRRHRVSHLFHLVLGMVLFLLVWQLWAAPFSPLSSLIPSPIEAVNHFLDNLIFSEPMRDRFVHACPDLAAGLEFRRGRLFSLPDYCFGYILHLLHTTRNILIAVGLGTVIGLGVGLSTLLIPWIADLVTPVAGFFGTTPIFIVAPFFVIWFGIDYPLLTTIGVVAFYTTLLMYFFTRRAAENIPAGIIESALTLGGDRRTIFRWVYLRGTVPEIAGGFRIALGGAWGLGTLVEVLGPQMGGGFLIRMFSYVVGRSEGATAVVGLILFFGVLAVVVDVLLVVVIRSFTRWSEGGRQLGL